MCSAPTVTIIRPSRVISEEETVTRVTEKGESVTDDEKIVTMNTVQSSLNTENVEDTVHIHTATHSSWLLESPIPVSSFTHSG